MCCSAALLGIGALLLMVRLSPQTLGGGSRIALAFPLPCDLPVSSVSAGSGAVIGVGPLFYSLPVGAEQDQGTGTSGERGGHREHVWGAPSCAPDPHARGDVKVCSRSFNDLGGSSC